jgi:molybdenum cofactor synthesis domain-containing protein
MTLFKNAAILIIGNEILSGRTQDQNVRFLAIELSKCGIPLKEVRVVSDDETAIIEAVNTLRKKYDVVFTTGGIGPTHDDITSECIAKAFGVPLLRHPEATELIRNHRPDIPLTESRLRMANIPEGASLVYNELSKAPGFKIENVYVFAGIPSIMQNMFYSIQNHLTGSGKPILSKSIGCNLPESLIAEGLEKIQNMYPHLEIGSYPVFEGIDFRVSLVVRGTKENDISKALDLICALITHLGGSPILTN